MPDYEEMLMDLMAVACRYGRQNLEQLRQMTREELSKFNRSIGRLLKAEAEAARRSYQENSAGGWG